MKSSTATLTTTDKLKIFYYAWVPDSAPKAVVVIVHGIGEHAGRYAHVGERFSRDGYAVYALDQRGHGKSEGERVHFDNFAQALSDLRQFFDLLRKEHPKLPIFMYGHSMGSGIALLFTLDYQHDLRGLIVSGTVTNVEENSSPLVINVAGSLANLFPKARLIPSLPAEVITSDPEQLKKYDQDPLNDRGNLRLGMAHKIILMGRDIRARAKTITLPILLMHGEDDKLTPISGSRTIYSLVSSPDKTILTYPGLRHELVNEVKRDDVLNDMVAWLNAH